MPTISQAQRGPLKILAVGPPGAGKTGLALTAGKVAQVIDVDIGCETAFGLKDQFSQNRLAVDYLPAPEISTDKMGRSDTTAFGYTMGYLYRIMNECNAGKYPFKILIIDSFTTVTDAAIKFVLKNTNRLDRPISVKENITQPEWGLIIQQIENFVTILRGLPIHVFLTAHSVPLLSEKGAFLKWELNVPTRKLPPRIPAYFDELYFFQVEEGAGGVRKRVIRTEPSPIWDARSRAGLPDNTDVNLGLPEIFKRLGREL
jgi:hypothetical protein